MTTPRISDNSPGTLSFPEYKGLYALIVSEVEGLDAAHLDFISDRWSWSGWSIRRQLDHVASIIYRWLLLRWGKTLFPHDGPLYGFTQPDYDNRIDERPYRELPEIMEKLRHGIDLAQSVLRNHTVGFLRSHTYTYPTDEYTDVIRRAHPIGLTVSGDGLTELITIEATFQHIYFEAITHLYNIQRLKRAQGLATVVNLPRVGYWILEGWDRSEP